MSSNFNFADYQDKTNLKFIYFPYAISNDFILHNELKKKYDLFFSGLIQNQYFFNLNKIKSSRIFIQRKLFVCLNDIPIIKKNYKNKIFWNTYTGIPFKDLILKILGRYKRMSRKEYIKKLHESKVVINTLSQITREDFVKLYSGQFACEENNVINSIFKPMEHYVH